MTFHKGGLIPKAGLHTWQKCPEGRCLADELAAERLKRVPLTEVHCLCRGDREWVARKERA